jgi:DNA invertase Pin-like site-specific DNA recombinase
MHNHESRRRQYGLAERARHLGWQEVVVIDDDLGRSGSGAVCRPGFERLLAAICEGRVGAVLSVEASRLARNGRDWHTLLEFCALVGSLLLDEDGIYDPRLANDRLLLGMKGTMSEMELSLLRQRSLEALKLKAQRGELFLTVAVGYIKVGRDRIEKDPDRRVREALALVFAKFVEFQSVRQVHLWLRQEGLTLPAVVHDAEVRCLVWKPPVYNTILHLLTNPIYAGAYAFGRTGSRMQLEGGRKRIVRGFKKPRTEWAVLLLDRHEGYVSWSEYERNQRLIADNAGNKGLMVRRAVRLGDTLLAGLIRCGHCGRKLHVAYSGTKGDVGRYHCRGAHINHGTARCISFGALRVDQAVGAQVLALLQPLGVEAALRAIEAHNVADDETRDQTILALEQARFEALRARRQYDAIDPENRLVASELERRWDERLQVVAQLEKRVEQLDAQRQPPMPAEERARLLDLGTDLDRSWHHPNASSSTRKRILRTVLNEIVARIDNDEIALVLHWQGGDHTALRVRKNPTGQHRWTTDAETGELIRVLARLMPDWSIAAVMNRAGKRTGRGNSWTEARVRTFRNQHEIAVYRDGERAARGELSLEEAATILAKSKMTILRAIRAGIIPGRQICKGAPWVIEREAVEALARDGTLTPTRRRPVTAHPQQESLDLP